MWKNLIFFKKRESDFKKKKEEKENTVELLAHVKHWLFPYPLQVLHSESHSKNGRMRKKRRKEKKRKEKKRKEKKRKKLRWQVFVEFVLLE